VKDGLLLLRSAENVNPARLPVHGALVFRTREAQLSVLGRSDCSRYRNEHSM
jgi:hypothetical protein